MTELGKTPVRLFRTQGVLGPVKTNQEQIRLLHTAEKLRYE